MPDVEIQIAQHGLLAEVAYDQRRIAQHGLLAEASCDERHITQFGLLVEVYSSPATGGRRRSYAALIG